MVSLNELQRTVRQYCIKDRAEFIEDILAFILKRLEDKDIPFSDFEEDVEKLCDSRGKNILVTVIAKTKSIRASDLQVLFSKDLRLNLTTIDEQLLFFHYKDRTNARYFNFDRFLDKMSKIMKNREINNPKRLKKDRGNMEFSEGEVRTILKRINKNCEENKINLSVRVQKYDNYEHLTEKDFNSCFGIRDLDLTQSELKALFNKYFNTLDEKVYVDQLLKDMHNQSTTLIGKDLNIKPGKGKSNNILKKLANKIKKERKEDRIIDE